MAVHVYITHDADFTNHAKEDARKRDKLRRSRASADSPYDFTTTAQARLGLPVTAQKSAVDSSRNYYATTRVFGVDSRRARDAAATRDKAYKLAIAERVANHAKFRGAKDAPPYGVHVEKHGTAFYVVGTYMGFTGYGAKELTPQTMATKAKSKANAEFEVEKINKRSAEAIQERERVRQLRVQQAQTYLAARAKRIGPEQLSFNFDRSGARDAAPWWELKGEINGRGQGRLIATNGIERKDLGASNDYAAVEKARKFVAEMNAKVREANKPKPAGMKTSRVGAALLRGRTDAAEFGTPEARSEMKAKIAAKRARLTAGLAEVAREVKAENAKKPDRLAWILQRRPDLKEKYHAMVNEWRNSFIDLPPFNAK